MQEFVSGLLKIELLAEFGCKNRVGRGVSYFLARLACV